MSSALEFEHSSVQFGDGSQSLVFSTLGVQHCDEQLGIAILAFGILVGAKDILQRRGAILFQKGSRRVEYRVGGLLWVVVLEGMHGVGRIVRRGGHDGGTGDTMAGGLGIYVPMFCFPMPRTTPLAIFLIIDMSSAPGRHASPPQPRVIPTHTLCRHRRECPHTTRVEAKFNVSAIFTCWKQSAAGRPLTPR